MFFDQDEKLYIILELADGGDLFDAVVSRKFYNEKDAKVILAELASAVGYLHNRGIAHRDLKPENILLTKTGHLKLSDFGLSRMIDSDQMMKTLCGTPQYLAPEIILESEGITEKGYSKAVDIWSMGVVLYIILAGFPPFGEDSFDDIKQGKYSFKDKRWGEVSAQAKDLISKMLTVDPTKRFTVDQIFSHPWMNGINRIPGTEGNNEPQKK